MKLSFVAATLAMGAAALPSVGDLRATAENSCIISGSTERPCATVAYAEKGDLEGRAVTASYGSPIDPLESRFKTHGFCEPLAEFRSDKRDSFVIFIR